MKNLTVYIIFFHIIFNVNCQYVPVGRSLHTATLVGTTIYFLGGTTSRIVNNKDLTRLNDFFYLDISKSFDKTKGALPFVNLTDKALEIPPHVGAMTSVFGELKDTIFFFGGNMGILNDQSYLFNTTQVKWRAVTVSRGLIPLKKQLTEAITDNNNRIYIFGGGFSFADSAENYLTNVMYIFDTISKIWTSVETGLVKRDGHTATFLPDTGEIVYIGGHGFDNVLIDIINLDVYNTINGRWDKWATKNPPEPRYGHTAVLTNDMRIIIFGGAQANIEQPVNNRYVVLNTKTLEWNHGKEDPSTRIPFRHHTATLYKDHMFIAFGYIDSLDNPNSDDIFIYKIGDYANFTEVNSFISEDTVKPESSVKENRISDNVILAFIVLGIIIILGLIGFIIFKWYKISRRDHTFSHVLNN